MVVHPKVRAPARCRLYEALCGDGTDELDGILGGKRKGKLPSRWAAEVDQDDDNGPDMDVEDEVPLLNSRSREGRDLEASARPGSGLWRKHLAEWRI